MTALAIDPLTPTTLYAAAGRGGTERGGLGRIYRSTDGGASWAKNSGVADDQISALVIPRQAPKTVYAATALSGVLKSTDAGTTWSPASTGLTSLRTVALAIDPRNPDALYVGTADKGVFKSVNGGASWLSVYPGLTNGVVTALAFDPLTPSTIYVAVTSPHGTDVFRSRDSGVTWARAGSAPMELPALAIDPLTCLWGEREDVR